MTRYRLSLELDIPAPTLAQAIERALRLLRPRVRENLRQTVSYIGRYKSRALWLQVRDAPPADRVNLKARRRRLRKP